MLSGTGAHVVQTLRSTHNDKSEHIRCLCASESMFYFAEVKVLWRIRRLYFIGASLRNQVVESRRVLCPHAENWLRRRWRAPVVVPREANRYNMHVRLVVSSSAE